MAKYDPNSHALVGAGGRLPVPEDDEVTRKLSMLIEGGPKVRLQQATLPSVADGLFPAGGCGTPKAEVWSEDQLPADGGSRPAGDPTPLPRFGCLDGGDCSETPPERVDDQQPQCATGD